MPVWRLWDTGRGLVTEIIIWVLAWSLMVLLAHYHVTSVVDLSKRKWAAFFMGACGFRLAVELLTNGKCCIAPRTAVDAVESNAG